MGGSGTRVNARRAPSDHTQETYTFTRLARSGPSATKRRPRAGSGVTCGARANGGRYSRRKVHGRGVEPLRLAAAEPKDEVAISTVRHSADSSANAKVEEDGRGQSQGTQPRSAAALEERLLAAIAEAELEGRRTVADALARKLDALRATGAATVIPFRGRQR